MNHIKIMLRLAWATPLTATFVSASNLLVEGPHSGEAPEGAEMFDTADIADLGDDADKTRDRKDDWTHRADGNATEGATFAIVGKSSNGAAALEGEKADSGAATPFLIGTQTPASGPAPPAPTEEISLYQAILTGQGSGEVVSHAKVGSEFVLAVTDNPKGGVTILKWIDGRRKYQTQFSIDLKSAVTNFAEVSSVALDPRGTGLGAALVQIDDPAVNTTGDLSIPQIGQIVFFNATTGAIVGQANTGYHPDMVAFGPTGICAVANEGQYAWDTDTGTPLPGHNQNGSVSLYDLSGVTFGDLASAASVSEVNVDFTHADLTGIRYGTAEEMEPEYVAFDVTGDSIFVGCQENNAVAYLADLDGILAATTTPAWEIHSLGSVSYTADASDRDGIDISDVIKGLHMPDAIAVYENSGNTYVVTADEGDARPDDSDIARGGSFVGKVAATPRYDAGNGPLSQAAFGELLASDDELGRLNVLVDQSTNGSGELENIIALGSRGISIWKHAGGALVRVSHVSLESYLANEDPDRHNSNDGGDPGEKDARSDDKGSEPEGVDVIRLGSKIVAMVGNERQNGAVMVDITDPADPTPVSYINSRDMGLISPETVKTVPASDSPTGAELAVFGFEGISGDGVSGGIGIYTLRTSAPSP